MSEQALLWIAAVSGVIGAIGSTAIGLQALFVGLAKRKARLEDELTVQAVRTRRDGTLSARVVFKRRQLNESVYATVTAARRKKGITRFWHHGATLEGPPVEFLPTGDTDIFFGLETEPDSDARVGWFVVWPSAVWLDVQIRPDHRITRRPIARRRIWITRMD